MGNRQRISLVKLVNYVIENELKKCPRCGKEFECKAGSISTCQCQAVELDSRQSDYVAAHYEDCLCLGCLSELRAEYNESTGSE